MMKQRTIFSRVSSIMRPLEKLQQFTVIVCCIIFFLGIIVVYLYSVVFSSFWIFIFLAKALTLLFQLKWTQ